MPATEYQYENGKYYYQKYTVDGQTYHIMVWENTDGKIERVNWATDWKENVIYIDNYGIITPAKLEGIYALRVGSKQE